MRRFSSALSRLLAYVGAAALALLMLLTVADIAGRYLLNRPVPGTFELTEISMVLIVFLALGLAQHDKEHIALDIVYNYLSPGLKRSVDWFVDLVNLIVVGAVVWQLWAYSERMADGNYTTAVLQLPIYPFVLIAIAGAFAYLLAILAEFGKSNPKDYGA